MKVLKIAKEIGKSLYNVGSKVFDFIFDTLFALNEDIDIEEMSFGDYHFMISQEEIKIEKDLSKNRPI